MYKKVNIRRFIESWSYPTHSFTATGLQSSPPGNMQDTSRETNEMKVYSIYTLKSNTYIILYNYYSSCMVPPMQGMLQPIYNVNYIFMQYSGTTHPAAGHITSTCTLRPSIYDRSR